MFEEARLKISIVEDDPLMQLGLEQALVEQAKFELVGQAENGQTGVEAALRLKPDLAIIDIGLPGLDGITVTKKIKETLPQILVIVLTSLVQKTEAIAALTSGADAYCIKGVDLERLLVAIAAVRDGATYLDPQIARLVLEDLKPAAPQPDTGALSKRELEILRLVVEGKSNTEIAKELYLSPNTIKTHVGGIMNKLCVNGRVQAAVAALRMGIV